MKLVRCIPENTSGIALVPGRDAQIQVKGDYGRQRRDGIALGAMLALVLAPSASRGRW